MAYILKHTDTGRVLATHKAAYGAVLTLATPGAKITKIQALELEWLESGAVWAGLAANTGLVVNRHSRTGAAILWPRADATPADSLLDTLTENGNQQVYLKHQPGLFLTADSEGEGAGVSFQAKRADSSQWWRFEEVELVASKVDLGIAPIDQLTLPGFSQAFRNNACLAVCLNMAASHLGSPVDMAGLVTAGCVNNSDAKLGLGYVHTPLPFVNWAVSHAGTAAGTYCPAVYAALDAGQPVVIKMRKNSSDHYVLATGYDSADLDGIWVNDPTGGVRMTLRQAYAKHSGSYVHMRVCRKGN